MKFKTRRRLFLIGLAALVSPLPLLPKLLIVTPIVQLLLMDFDEWQATQRIKLEVENNDDK